MKNSLQVFSCSFILVNIILPMFFLPVSIRAQSQVRDFNITKKLANLDIADVRKEIDFYASDRSGSAEATYLLAVVQEDAQKALELYNQVKVSFPESPLAAAAVFQMGNYYLARGLYISARRFYLEVVEKYPDLELVPNAMYLAASCMCAARQLDTCRDELENFIKQYRSSEFSKLAREDLRDIGAVSSLPPAQEVYEAGGLYTLQLGAFSQTNHALNLRNYFAKLGFPVEIKEKQVGGKTVYTVLLGSFNTQQSARSFGETIKKDHGKPYRVVMK